LIFPFIYKAVSLVYIPACNLGRAVNPSPLLAYIGPLRHWLSSEVLSELYWLNKALPFAFNSAKSQKCGLVPLVLSPTVGPWVVTWKIQYIGIVTHTLKCWYWQGNKRFLLRLKVDTPDPLPRTHTHGIVVVGSWIVIYWSVDFV
jgi:hypothetical protein